MNALERLEKEPERFTLFAALRLLEQTSGSAGRLGETGRPRDDRVRLAQPPHLHFAPSDVRSFDPARSPAPRLEQYGFGLFGPNGPLPLHLTEYCFDRQRQADDPGPADFINLLQHRLITLFYRAWANSDPTTHRDRPESDQFALDFGAFIGLGESEARARDGVDDLAKLARASHLIAQARSALGLQEMLIDYFEVPLEILPFVGSWLEIPDEAVTRLGGTVDNARLGAGATLGARSWQCQNRFEIRLGPLEMPQFENFLPGAPGLVELAHLVRFYTHDEWSWQVRLVLHDSEAAAAQSDLQLGAHGRLGWTSWSGRRPILAADVVIDGDAFMRNANKGERNG